MEWVELRVVGGYCAFEAERTRPGVDLGATDFVADWLPGLAGSKLALVLCAGVRFVRPVRTDSGDWR